MHEFPTVSWYYFHYSYKYLLSDLGDYKHKGIVKIQGKHVTQNKHVVTELNRYYL